MSENKIPLAAAFIRQSLDVESNAWLVYTDDGKKILGRFSHKLTDKEAMASLRFARQYELEAFNTGIRFGEKQEHEKAEVVFQSMRAKIKELETQNIGLSTQLERLIISEGET